MQNTYQIHIKSECETKSHRYYSQARTWNYIYWGGTAFIGLIGLIVSTINFIAYVKNVPPELLVNINNYTGYVLTAMTSGMGFLNPSKRSTLAESAGDEYTVLLEDTLLGIKDNSYLQERFVDLTRKFNDA